MHSVQRTSSANRGVGGTLQPQRHGQNSHNQQQSSSSLLTSHQQQRPSTSSTAASTSSSMAAPIKGSSSSPRRVASARVSSVAAAVGGAASQRGRGGGGGLGGVVGASSNSAVTLPSSLTDALAAAAVAANLSMDGLVAAEGDTAAAAGARSSLSTIGDGGVDQQHSSRRSSARTISNAHPIPMAPSHFAPVNTSTSSPSLSPAAAANNTTIIVNNPNQFKHQYIQPSTANSATHVKHFYSEMSFLLQHTVGSIAHTLGATKCVLMVPSNGAAGGQQRLMAHPQSATLPRQQQHAPKKKRLQKKERTESDLSSIAALRGRRTNGGGDGEGDADSILLASEASQLTSSSEDDDGADGDDFLAGAARPSEPSAPVLMPPSIGGSGSDGGRNGGLAHGHAIDASSLRPNKVGAGFVYPSNSVARQKARSAAGVGAGAGGGEGLSSPSKQRSHAASGTANTTTNSASNNSPPTPHSQVNNDLFAIAAWGSNVSASSATLLASTNASTAAAGVGLQQSPTASSGAAASATTASSMASVAATTFLPHDFVAKGDGASTASLSMRLNLLINCGGQMEPVGASGVGAPSSLGSTTTRGGGGGGGVDADTTVGDVQGSFTNHHSKVVDESRLPSTRKSLYHSALYVPIELDSRQCWAESNGQNLATAASTASGLPTGPIAVLVLLNKLDTTFSSSADDGASMNTPSAAAPPSPFTSFTVQDESLALSCARGTLAPLLLRCWNYGRLAKVTAGAGAGAWGETKSFVPYAAASGGGGGGGGAGTLSSSANNNNGGGGGGGSALPSATSPSAMVGGGNTHRVAVDMGGRVTQPSPSNLIDYSRLRIAFEEDYRPKWLGTDNRARFAVDYCGRGLLSVPSDNAAAVSLAAHHHHLNAQSNAQLASASSKNTAHLSASSGADITTKGSGTNTSVSSAHPNPNPAGIVNSNNAVPRAKAQLLKSFKEALITRVGMLPPIEATPPPSLQQQFPHQPASNHSPLRHQRPTSPRVRGGIIGGCITSRPPTNDGIVGAMGRVGSSSYAARPPSSSTANTARMLQVNQSLLSDQQGTSISSRPTTGGGLFDAGGTGAYHHGHNDNGASSSAFPRGRIPLSVEGGVYDPQLAEHYLQARVHNATRTENSGAVGTSAAGAGATRVFHGHVHRDLVRFNPYDPKGGAGGGHVSDQHQHAQPSSLLAILDIVGLHTPLIPLLDYVARLEHVAGAFTAAMYSDHVEEAARREQYLKGVMIRAARAEEQNARLTARNEALVRENVTREREIAQLKDDISAMIEAGVVNNTAAANSVSRGGMISAVMSGSSTTQRLASAAGVRGMFDASGGGAPRRDSGRSSAQNFTSPTPPTTAMGLTSPAGHRSAAAGAHRHGGGSASSAQGSPLPSTPRNGGGGGGRPPLTIAVAAASSSFASPSSRHQHDPTPASLLLPSLVDGGKGGPLQHAVGGGRASATTTPASSGLPVAPLSPSSVLRRPSASGRGGGGGAANVSFATDLILFTAPSGGGGAVVGDANTTPPRPQQSSSRVGESEGSGGSGGRRPSASFSRGTAEADDGVGEQTESAVVTLMSTNGAEGEEGGSNALPRDQHDEETVDDSPAEEHRTRIARWMDSYEQRRMKILDEMGL